MRKSVEAQKYSGLLVIAVAEMGRLTKGLSVFMPGVGIGIPQL